MFDIEDSSMNGWFFKSLKEGKGIGTCVNGCGETIEIKDNNQANNLKPCDCINNLKKTSQEWQNILSDVKVIDPDGWDRTNYEYSWKEELITEDEYLRRCGRSTCTDMQ